MEKRTGAGPRVTRVTRLTTESVTKSDLGWTVHSWVPLFSLFLSLSLSYTCQVTQDR